MLCQQASLASAVFLALLPPCLVARNIVFPPVAPVQANLNDVDSPNHSQSYQSSLGLNKDQFLSYNKFAGLTTFANLPWVHCLSKDGDVEKYDIAFLGAPFDTGTTGRPGARFGPAGIRL